MNRSTKEFTTSGGTKIIYKSYLTAREMNEVKRVIYGAAQADPIKAAVGGVAATKGLPDSFVIDAEKRVLEQAIVQVGDVVTGQLVEALLDLPSKEYDEVVIEITKALQVDFQPPK